MELSSTWLALLTTFALHAGGISRMQSSGHPYLSVSQRKICVYAPRQVIRLCSPMLLLLWSYLDGNGRFQPKPALHGS
jgi:hypothetical protein